MSTIIILDDIELTCRHIKQNIEKTDREIIICTTLNNTLDVLQQKSVDFLITDLKLSNKIILPELEEIKKIYPSMKIIVITGIKISAEEIYKKRLDVFFEKPLDFQALDLILSPPIIHEESIKVLERQLQIDKNNFLFQILENMDVGISIVDLNRNVIYANIKQINISGKISVGKPCYLSFAPHSRSFCDKCPVLEPHNIVTHVRSGGYYDIHCVRLKNDNSDIIAIAKISQEVTDRERLVNLKEKRLGTMPLRERCEKILDAIQTMNFGRIRLYIVSEDGKHLIGYAVKGQQNDNLIGKSELIKGDKYKEKTFKDRVPQIHRAGEFDNPWFKYCDNDRYVIYWAEIPLVKDNIPLGLIYVDNYDENYPDITYENIKPINKDALNEISRMSQNLIEAISSEIEIRKIDITKMLISLDHNISKMATTEEILNTMIMGCVNVIQHYWKYAYRSEDCDFVVTGHIMMKTGNWLKKVAGIGILYDKSPGYLELSTDIEAPCVKVVNDQIQIPFIIEDLFADENWGEFVKKFRRKIVDDESVKYIESLQSVGCFPIISKGDIIGTISIQSPKPNLFNDYIRELVSGFVAKCIPEISALYLVEKERLLFSKIISLSKKEYLLSEIKNEDKFIWTMLTMLTHHDGFGYNRAIYFRYNVSDGYKGIVAVGPIDKVKAKETYAAMSDPITIEDAIAESENRNKELTNFIENKILPDNIFTNKATTWNGNNDLFSEMPKADEFLSLRLSFGEKIYGGILLDNFYSGIKFSEKDSEILQGAVSTFALFLHNLHMDLKRFFDPKVFKAIITNPDLLEIKARTLTIAFWDIRGFSSLCENLKEKPLLISQFLQEYFNVAQMIIYKHQGILDKFIGDGVMALFGALSENGEDDYVNAVNAVNAAIDFKEEFNKIKTKWAKTWKSVVPHKINIGLGSGIHSGPALVGKVGTENRDQFTALGPHVNFAKRIESKAENQIRISQTTHELIADFFEVEYLETLNNVKHIPGEFEIFEVIRRSK